MPLITTAALTTAVILLGKEAAKGAASKAGEKGTELAVSAFAKVKSLLGLNSAPDSPALQAEVEAALTRNPEAMAKVQQVVEDYRVQVGGVSIGTVAAKTALIGQNTFNGPATFG